MTSSRIRFVLAMSVLLVSTRRVASQQLDRTHAGIQLPKPADPDRPPTNFELAATSVGGATGGALIGAIAGLVVDGAYCQRHHGREPSLFLGPCFLYTGAGLAIGWSGGAAVGGTWGAVHVARKRGCTHEAATTGAAVGAVMGVVPGILMMASGSVKYPPPLRSMFIAGAPILSGIGGSVAVLRCRSPS